VTLFITLARCGSSSQTIQARHVSSGSTPVPPGSVSGVGLWVEGLQAGWAIRRGREGYTTWHGQMCGTSASRPSRPSPGILPRARGRAGSGSHVEQVAASQAVAQAFGASQDANHGHLVLDTSSARTAGGTIGPISRLGIFLHLIPSGKKCTQADAPRPTTPLTYAIRSIGSRSHRNPKEIPRRPCPEPRPIRLAVPSVVKQHETIGQLGTLSLLPITCPALLADEAARPESRRARVFERDISTAPCGEVQSCHGEKKVAADSA